MASPDGGSAACSRRTICWTASVCISRSSRTSCASRASTSDSLKVKLRRMTISPAGSQSLAGRVVQAERHALRERELAHAAAAGQRQHLLVVDRRRDVEDHLGARLALSTTRAPPAPSSARLSSVRDRRRRRRVDVDRRERVVELAAQLEAAGAEQQRGREGDQRPRERRRACARRAARLDDDIDEPPRHDDDLLHRHRRRRASPTSGLAPRRRLDRRAVGTGRARRACRAACR